MKQHQKKEPKSLEPRGEGSRGIWGQDAENTAGRCRGKQTTQTGNFNFYFKAKESQEKKNKLLYVWSAIIRGRGK